MSELTKKLDENTRFFVKIGLIGIGQWGKNFVPALSNLGVLSALSDRHAERIANAKTQVSKPVFVTTNYADLLQQPIDAVVIATPAETHFEIARDFLLAGKDVFVEKPLAMNASQARDLCELAAAKKRILMVGHLLLFHPAIEMIQAWVSENKLGKIYRAHFQRMKLGRVRNFENVLWSFGVHDLAVFSSLFSGPLEVVSVTGQDFIKKPQAGGSKVEDEIHVELKNSKGVYGHFHCSWTWPFIQKSLLITGEKGSLLLDEHKGQLWHYPCGVQADLQNFEGTPELLYEGKPELLTIELKAFIESIQTRKAPRTDGLSALHTVEIMDAVKKCLQS